ncbi:MAG: hypothetical protein FVQ77_02965 [Cytophagales bacterium]|nr:hypothetical protein [Cytophagales bacterium]
MKHLKLFSFTALSISCLLASCNMEKRIYFSGYHVEWKKRGHHSGEQQAAGGSNKIKETEAEIAATETFAGETITASVGDQPALEKEKIYLWAVDNEKTTAVEDQDEYTIEPFGKKEITPATLHSDGSKLNGMALLGFICFVLGHILFPLWLLGVIFSAIGLHQIKKHPDRWKSRGLARAVLRIAAVEIILSIMVLLLVLLILLLDLGSDGFV